MTRILRVLPLLLVLASLPLSAQVHYKIGKLTFKNPGPYDQAGLEATTGLRAGLPLDETILQQADQKLMDTGLFEDAQATLNGNVSSVTVTFTLTPVAPEKLLPVRFDNLVWWSPEELTAAIRQSVPLFHGSLPEAGNLGDAVEAALQSLLTAKGIAEPKVIHETAEPTAASPIRSITFALASPEVQLHSVSLRSTTLDPKLEASLIGRPYNEASLVSALLTSWRNGGYLGASLTNITRTPTASANVIHVDFAASVQPGDIYHVASIHFAGTGVFSADAFSKAATLKPGDLASQKALAETLAPIHAAYHAQGYMNAAVLATPTLDTTAHTAAYEVTVTPGAQFTLRSVHPNGLNPQQAAAFQTVWKLHPGDLYNPDAIESFLLHNIAVPPFKGMSALYKATAEPDTNQVDLVINFSGTPIR